MTTCRPFHMLGCVQPQVNNWTASHYLHSNQCQQKSLQLPRLTVTLQEVFVNKYSGIVSIFESHS